jgi:hypothetical protein
MLQAAKQEQGEAGGSITDSRRWKGQKVQQFIIYMYKVSIKIGRDQEELQLSQ